MKIKYKGKYSPKMPARCNTEINKYVKSKKQI